MAAESAEIFAPHPEKCLGMYYDSFQPFRYLWVTVKGIL
jgi:hypothetical protein